jgi:hypothetical protein
MWPKKPGWLYHLVGNCVSRRPGWRSMFFGVRSDCKGTNSQFDNFFYISLPVSLAFLTLMVGDILASKGSKFIPRSDVVNRRALALLCGCETWQMILMCLLEEILLLAQLITSICLAIVMALFPQNLGVKWLPAVFVLLCVCFEVGIMNERPSGFLVFLYASVAATNSKFFKYLIHFCIVTIDFYRNDCMLSHMIMMVASGSLRHTTRMYPVVFQYHGYIKLLITISSLFDFALE